MARIIRTAEPTSWPLPPGNGCYQGLRSNRWPKDRRLWERGWGEVRTKGRVISSRDIAGNLVQSSKPQTEIEGRRAFVNWVSLQNFYSIVATSTLPENARKTLIFYFRLQQSLHVKWKLPTHFAQRLGSHFSLLYSWCSFCTFFHVSLFKTMKSYLYHQSVTYHGCAHAAKKFEHDRKS